MKNQLQPARRPALALVQHALLAAFLTLGAGQAAWAQNNTAAASHSVALTGILGNKALLVIDGGAPKAVEAGSSYQKLQVLSVKDGEAQIRMDGQTFTVRMGESPVSVAGKGLPVSNTGRIVLMADTRGHFMTPGMINGKATHFVVDTGATTVSLGMAEARKLGIDYSKGERVQMGTANGVAEGWRLKLNTVRVSDVELRNVDAAIASTDMPFVLLGNSFLNSFQMNRTGQQLTLDRMR